MTGALSASEYRWVPALGASKDTRRVAPGAIGPLSATPAIANECGSSSVLLTETVSVSPSIARMTFPGSLTSPAVGLQPRW